MRPLCILLTGLLGSHLSAVNAAGEIPKGPKFAVHVQPHTTTKGVDVCGTGPTENLLPCSAYSTHGEVGQGYDLFIVVCQADSNGVGGAAFGIDYNGLAGQGVDLVGGWILCASGLQFPSADWPAPGSGNVLTWNTVTGCGDTMIPPDGVHATAGAFYVYAYGQDRFWVTPHMRLESGPALEMANCLGAEIPVHPDLAGHAGFGPDAGLNPCAEPTPVEPTTWGRLKTRFGHE